MGLFRKYPAIVAAVCKHCGKELGKRNIYGADDDIGPYCRKCYAHCRSCWKYLRMRGSTLCRECLIKDAEK